jgi:uncharacterized protein YbjT (DUF2867 family)
MKILITGASGNVGNGMMARLRRQCDPAGGFAGTLPHTSR